MIKAKQGDIVKVHCTAKLEDGTIFFSTLNHQPLKFTIGEGRVIDDVEKAVIGMNPGESKIAAVPVEKALNPLRKEKIVEIERSKFPDWEPKLGQRLKIFKPDGRLIAAKVTNISESKVALDFRRSFTDKVLMYDLQLEEIV